MYIRVDIQMSYETQLHLMKELNRLHTGKEEAPKRPSKALRDAHYSFRRNAWQMMNVNIKKDGTFSIKPLRNR